MENAIQNQSPQSNGELTLEKKIETANNISRTLLYSLGREYLGYPQVKQKIIQPVPARNIYTEEVKFLHLDQIGNLSGDNFSESFTAIQTVLSACHMPGQNTFVFLVTSDGQTNNIFLGIRSIEFPLYPTEDFTANIGHFLQGNWPGTVLSPCEQTDPVFKKNVTDLLQNKLKHAVALTGIPSLKKGDVPGDPQSLDRLLKGLRGQPFVYMVVADPIPMNQVDETIAKCRDLLSRVHSLTKLSVSRGETLGTSEELSYGGSYSKSKSTADNQVTQTSKDHTQSINIGGTLAFTTMALLFPDLAELADIAVDAFPTLVNLFYHPDHSSTNTSTTDGETWTKSITRGKGLNYSSAQTIGEEYLNIHAQAAEELLQQYIARFEQARALGCWNVGTYLITDRPDTAFQGGNQLRALLSGEKSTYEPVRVHMIENTWVKEVRKSLQEFEQPNLAIVKPKSGEGNAAIAERVEHPLGSMFNGLTTPLNMEELALLVNLPHNEVSGIPVTMTADFSLNVKAPDSDSIKIGNLLESGKETALTYSVTPKTLAKHTLITGMTGSGKSTTCRILLDSVWKKGIPFLVIEPAKDEYVQWAIERNKTLPENDPNRISIFMPGANTGKNPNIKDLHINPLDVVWLSADQTPQVLSHLDRLKSVLNAAFPMQESLPILLEDILFQTLSRPTNWLSDELPAFGTKRPTLTQMLDNVIPVVSSKGYEDNVRDNLTAALLTRLQSLCRGWKKQLFDQQDSTNWAELFDRPVVINLSQMGDEADKSLAMSLIFLFLYEYRQAQNELNPGAHQELSHLTLIEEAHRILLQPKQESADHANPQAKTAEMFSNILSEIRAYGEGFAIVDQVPARLIPDAVKNTNLKIIHRLVANDDREAMGGCMALTPDQTKIINRLRPGQAIIYGDLDDMAAWVKINQ